MTDINKIYLGSQDGKAVDRAKLKAGIQIDKFSDDSKKLAQAFNTTQNANGEFDNVLDQEEIMKFWDKLSHAAKDNTLNKRGGDINRFLESLGFKKGEFSKEQVMKFLQEVVELNDEIDSVKNVVSENKNGEKVLSGIKVAYKSGGGQINADSTLVEAGTYTDGSNSQTIKDSNGHTTFTSKDADGKTTLVHYDRNTQTSEGVKRFIDGSIINHQEDIYLNDEDNSTSDTLRRRITVTEDGLTVVQEYNNKGTETSRNVSYFNHEQKTSVEAQTKFIKTADGKIVQVMESETYNKGLPNEYTTVYTEHDADGNPLESVTSKINPETGEMQDITTTYKDGKKETETIKEGNDLTRIVYGENGKPEIKHELKNYQTTYDEEGNPQYDSKTMVSTTYDKEGNPVAQKTKTPEGETVVNFNDNTDTVVKPPKKQYRRTNPSATRAQEECAERAKTTLQGYKIDPQMNARKQVAHDLVEYYKAQGLSDEQAQAKVFSKSTVQGKDFYNNISLETPEGIAMYLFTQEGNKSVTKSSFEARVKQIKDSNPGKFDAAGKLIGGSISDVELNLPVDAKLYEKWGGEAVRQRDLNVHAEEHFANQQGSWLAQQARLAIIGKNDKYSLNDVMAKVDSSNITEFLQTYQEKYGKNFVDVVHGSQGGAYSSIMKDVKAHLNERLTSLGLTKIGYDDIEPKPEAVKDAIYEAVRNIRYIESNNASTRADAVANMNNLHADAAEQYLRLGNKYVADANNIINEQDVNENCFEWLYSATVMGGGMSRVRGKVDAFKEKLTAIREQCEIKDAQGNVTGLDQNKFKELYKTTFDVEFNPTVINQASDANNRLQASLALEGMEKMFGFSSPDRFSETELRSKLFNLYSDEKDRAEINKMTKQELCDFINARKSDLVQMCNGETDPNVHARQLKWIGGKAFGEKNNVVGDADKYVEDARKGGGHTQLVLMLSAGALGFAGPVAGLVGTAIVTATPAVSEIISAEMYANEVAGSKTYKTDAQGAILYDENGQAQVAHETTKGEARLQHWSEHGVDVAVQTLAGAVLIGQGGTMARSLQGQVEAGLLSKSGAAGRLILNDAGVGIGLEYATTGTVTKEGVALSTLLPMAFRVRSFKPKFAKEIQSGNRTQPEPTPGKTPEANVLDVATGDNTHGVGGKLGTKPDPKTKESKFETAKRQTRDIAQNGTVEDVVKVHDEAGKLRAVSRDQGRPLEQIILDENNIVQIGKERIDLATADAPTLARAKKAVENYSGRGIDKIKTAIEARETELANGTVRTEPARSTQVNDGINARVKNDVKGSLNTNKNKSGTPIAPHDAATMTDHIANNLNDINSLESFIRDVETRIGFDDQGRLFKMEVNGVDHGARVIEAANKKLNRLKAQKADLNNVTSKIDDAIANEGKGPRGLNGTEQQAIKDFANRSNSIEDLQALVTKLRSNKSVKKSANGIIGFIENKLTVLRAKAVSTQTGSGELNAVKSKPAPQTTVKVSVEQKAPVEPKPVEASAVESRPVEADAVPTEAKAASEPKVEPKVDSKPVKTETPSEPSSVEVKSAQSNKSQVISEPKAATESKQPVKQEPVKADEVSVIEPKPVIEDTPVILADEAPVLEVEPVEILGYESPVVDRPVEIIETPVEIVDRPVEIFDTPIVDKPFRMVDVDMSASKLTGRWKNFNRQIETARTQSALIEAERTIDLMPDCPEKTFLKNKIKQKKAELDKPVYEPLENSSSRPIEEQYNYYDDIQYQQDIANQMMLDPYSNPDLYNVNPDDGFIGF